MPSLSAYLVVGGAAALVTFVCIPIVIRLSPRFGAMVQPTDRHVHTRPTSTAGGAVSITAGHGSSTTAGQGGALELVSGKGAVVTGGHLQVSTGEGATSTSGALSIRTANAGTKGANTR